MAWYILRLIIDCVSERGTQNILSFCVFRLLTESTRQTRTHKHLYIHTHTRMYMSREVEQLHSLWPSLSKQKRKRKFPHPTQRQREWERDCQTSFHRWGTVRSVNNSAENKIALSQSHRQQQKHSIQTYKLLHLHYSHVECLLRKVANK